MENQVFTDRYEDMVRYIQDKRKVSVNELSLRFQTSPCTIRRVLTQMEQENLVKRYYGGAAFNGVYSPEPPINKRAVINAAEKDLIGKAAAGLISDEDTVILLGGATVNTICPYLKNKRALKVITNSILIVNELLMEENVEVVFLGGTLNRKEMVATGYLTSLCIKELRASKLFLGVRAIHPLYGLMLDNINELEMYRSFMNSAQERIVMADYSKFDQSGTIVLSPVSQVNKIITDDKAPQDPVRELRQQGIEVIIAKKEHE